MCDAGADAGVDVLRGVVLRVAVEVAAGAVLAARNRGHRELQVDVVRPAEDRDVDVKRQIDVDHVACELAGRLVHEIANVIVCYCGVVPHLDRRAQLRTHLIAVNDDRAPILHGLHLDGVPADEGAADGDLVGGGQVVGVLSALVAALDLHRGVLDDPILTVAVVARVGTVERDDVRVAPEDARLRHGWGRRRRGLGHAASTLVRVACVAPRRRTKGRAFGHVVDIAEAAIVVGDRVAACGLGHAASTLVRVACVAPRRRTKRRAFGHVVDVAEAAIVVGDRVAACGLGHAAYALVLAADVALRSGAEGRALGGVEDEAGAAVAVADGVAARSLGHAARSLVLAAGIALRRGAERHALGRVDDEAGAAVVVADAVAAHSLGHAARALVCAAEVALRRHTHHRPFGRVVGEAGATVAAAGGAASGLGHTASVLVHTARVARRKCTARRVFGHVVDEADAAIGVADSVNAGPILVAACGRDRGCVGLRRRHDNRHGFQQSRAFRRGRRRRGRRQEEDRNPDHEQCRHAHEAEVGAALLLHEHDVALAGADVLVGGLDDPVAGAGAHGPHRASTHEGLLCEACPDTTRRAAALHVALAAFGPALRGAVGVSGVAVVAAIGVAAAAAHGTATAHGTSAGTVDATGGAPGPHSVGAAIHPSGATAGHSKATRGAACWDATARHVSSSCG
mmetsp:Transcript_172010/g.551339  ORF Transcript_172010/g.551339 Transcript_172010/m.551339 type:complete len:684 (-) Transcript_172010:275-2326(-)